MTNIVLTRCCVLHRYSAGRESSSKSREAEEGRSVNKVTHSALRADSTKTEVKKKHTDDV